MPTWDDDEEDLELNQETIEEIAASADLKQVTEEAKTNFSFKDKLAGMGGRRAKVLIFTDDQAVLEYNQSSMATKALAQMVAEAQRQAAEPDATDEQKETAERLLQSHNNSDELLEERRQTMLSTAWAFHMRSVPNIAVKIARREARKAIKQRTWEDDEERDEVQTSVFRRYLLRDVIERVAFADGTELHPTLDDLKDLEDKLDVAQWQRLVDQLNLLVFLDTVADAATDDPGF